MQVLVGQPARQLRDRARTALPGPARRSSRASARRSRAVSGQSSNASTTASSMVCFGPVNQFFADTCHQIVSRSRAPERHDRRVVDELPLELVAERVRRRGRRQHQVERHDDDLGDRERVHPLVLRAVVPRADLELVAVPPAQADRDRERQVEADHRDRGDRVERQRDRRAVDVDLDQRRQGQDRAGHRRRSITALAGHPLGGQLRPVLRARDRTVAAEREGHPRRRGHARRGAEELRGRRDEQHRAWPSWCRATATKIAGHAAAGQRVVGLSVGVVRDREHHAQQQDVAAEHRVEDRAPDALGRGLGRRRGLLGEVGARRRSR